MPYLYDCLIIHIKLDSSPRRGKSAAINEIITLFQKNDSKFEIINIHQDANKNGTERLALILVLKEFADK